MAGKENAIVKYDNTFNKTSLTFFSKVETDVLFSILSYMTNDNKKDEDGRYSRDFTFSEIRKLTGSKKLHTSRIKKALDSLLASNVEYVVVNENGVREFVKANLFSHYKVNEYGAAEIVLTSHMSEKLEANENQYTIIEVDEYTSLSTAYAKDIHRLLRQYRHTGFFTITKDELLRILNPPNVYNDYETIRKVILPAMKQNEKFFDNLSVNIKDNKILQKELKFTFTKHPRMKRKEIRKNPNGNRTQKDTELESVQDYVRKHMI